jgi:twitching motility two-component system response regulator PilG
LILLDITMPRLDGYQLCRIIKSNKDLRNTPVVMLSGKDGLLDKVKGRMAGASDYITKPFNPNALVKTVRKHVTP